MSLFISYSYVAIFVPYSSILTHLNLEFRSLKHVVVCLCIMECINMYCQQKQTLFKVLVNMNF